MPNIILAIIAFVPSGLLGWFWLQASRRASAAEAQLKPIADARGEADRIRAAAKREAEAQRHHASAEAEKVRAAAAAEADQVKAAAAAAAAATTTEAERFASSLNDRARADNAVLAEERIRLLGEIDRLRATYTTGAANYERLAAEIRSLEENLELLEAGLYSPHFTYEDSEQYKRALSEVVEEQKALVKSRAAVFGPSIFYMNGDKQAGARVIKRQQKLLLRAFNAESEAAIANVTWSNLATMEKRVTKAFEALNELSAEIQTGLTQSYLQLRLKELRLVHEEAEKRRREKEEQRLQRAAEREEEKVQRELAKAREAAEKEEEKFERALERARAELGMSVAEERDAMSAKIAELEARLADAHDRKERAIAQAQLTKVGHVYIISNHGAFGEGIVKIGMTRRLEPEERIQELGDASVPFPFDLHALIYSEDAPSLEYKLHEAFWEHRINWANDRKEFFRVDLQTLQARIREIGLDTELHMIPEAREYRETLAAIAAKQQEATPAASAPVRRPFAADPFREDDE